MMCHRIRELQIITVLLTQVLMIQIFSFVTQLFYWVSYYRRFDRMCCLHFQSESKKNLPGPS